MSLNGSGDSAPWTHCVLDCAVAELRLESPGIIFIGEGVAGRVPEHVRVCLEAEPVQPRHPKLR